MKNITGCGFRICPHYDKSNLTNYHYEHTRILFHSGIQLKKLHFLENCLNVVTLRKCVKLFDILLLHIVFT